MTKPAVPLSYLLAVLLCCVSGAVLAHEGHHEDQPEAVAPAVAPAPRATLDTPRIELVAQREDGDIVLYLDDYATNAPLDGLQVSVRSGSLTLQAAAGGEGAYHIAGDLIDARVEQPLDISVHGAGLDAQLQAVLPPAAEAVPAEQATLAQHDVWWIAATVLAAACLLGAAWLLWRRREGRVARGFGTA